MFFVVLFHRAHNVGANLPWGETGSYLGESFRHFQWHWHCLAKPQLTIQPTSLKSTLLISANCTTHLLCTLKRWLITVFFKAHVMSYSQEKKTEFSTWLHLISSCNCRCYFLLHTKPIACFLNTPSSFWIWWEASNGQRNYYKPLTCQFLITLQWYVFPWF